MIKFTQHPLCLSVVLLIIAMLSIQSSGALAKMLFTEFPILSVSAMRLFLGSVFLAFLFKIWKVSFQHINWPAIISYGIALAGMNALFYIAISRLPLGIAVSFEFIGPLSLALYYARQRFDFIWIGLAILGLILLFPFNKTTQPIDLIGVFFALSAGACWALYIVAGQKPSGISGHHTVCLGMFIGMLCLMPMALYVVGIPSRIFIEPYTLLQFSLLAILASALPFSLEMYALRNMTPFVFGTLTSLEPAIAALSGFVFLSESLLWTQWLALSILIIASVGCTLSKQHQKTIY